MAAATQVTAQLTVTHLNHAGDGCALYDGRRAYIPFTLPGETVTAELTPAKSHYEGRLISIETPHAARAAAPCPHFTQCGGCRLQHAGPAFYAAWKAERTRALFEKAGLAAPEAPLFITPPGTRRRAVFSAAKNESTVTLGFNRRASHALVDLAACPVLHPRLVALLAPLRALLSGILKNGESLDIHATHQEGAVELVFLGRRFSRDEEKALVAFGLAHGVGALYARAKDHETQIILSAQPLAAHYGGHSVALPPATFLQASADAERALLDFIAPHLERTARIADLFCGSGLFALSFCAGKKEVLAADLNGPALEALRGAAKALPQVSVERRNLFKEPFPAARFRNMDAVILDPPRAGAAAQIAGLAESAARKIIYISCNPQSFASDARLLQDKGWRMTALGFFDQFLWSAHLELTAVFERA